MKKYFIIVLPLIASCNGLGKSTVCNVNPQGQSSGAADSNQVYSLNAATLQCYLKKSAYNKLMSCYDSFPFLAEYDCQCYLKNDKLPFWAPNGAGILEEKLTIAKAIWDRGDTIFGRDGKVKDEYKELDGGDFLGIPCKIRDGLLDLFSRKWLVPPRYQRLLDVLDIFEQNLSPSYKENNPTYLDEMFCLKALFVRHLDEIDKTFYKLLDFPATEDPKIESPFALACFSGSRSVLEGFLNFIKSKNIKISMNNEQIKINVLNCSIQNCEDYSIMCHSASTSQYLAPSEYLVQCGDIDRLHLLIDYCKEADKDVLFDCDKALLMASRYGNWDIFKLLIKAGGLINSHIIMHLIDSGHSFVVLKLLNEGFIDEQNLIITKDDSVRACYLRNKNVFICTVKRYMDIVAPIGGGSIVILQKELNLLGDLLKLLIDKGVNILEKHSRGCHRGINILAHAIFNGYRFASDQARDLGRPKSSGYINNLILLLTKHDDFLKMVHEFSAKSCKESRTLCAWINKKGSSETKKILESIPSSS